MEYYCRFYWMYGGDTQKDQVLIWGITINKCIYKLRLLFSHEREISGIFAGISEVIHLTPFLSESVYDQPDKIQRETIDIAYKLEHELVTECAKSSPIEQHIKSFYSALMAATGKGKSREKRSCGY